MKYRSAALLLALSLLVSATLPSFAAGRFPDVPAGAWYADAVEAAASRGWIQGTGNGSFAPEQKMAWSDFLTLLTRMFCPETVQLYVSSALRWYDPYCNAALFTGMLSGTQRLAAMDPPGSGDWRQCGAETPLSRQEMALVLCNSGVSAPADLSGDGQIADWDRIPQKYREAVLACYSAGLLQGDEQGRFNGERTMTRAEAAVILCRMYSYRTGETLPGTGTASAEDTLTAYRQEVLRLVNLERARENCPALILNEALCAAAQVRAEELAQNFSRDRPDGRDCFTVLDDAGIVCTRAAENPAAGQRTPEEVVRAWMESSGHRANILTPELRKLGVGHVVSPSSPYGTCWALLLTD